MSVRKRLMRLSRWALAHAGRRWGTLILWGGLAVSTREAEARVFFRWRSAGAVGRTIESCGGREAYRSRVTFNGREGLLVLYGFEGRSTREVSAELSRRLPSAIWDVQGATLAMASVQTDRGGAARMLIVGLEREGQTLVFLFASEGGSSPSADWASVERFSSLGLAPFPGSQSQVLAEDRQRGVSLWIHRAPAEPQVVRAYYLQQLVGSGWSPEPPTGRSSGSVVVLTRGAELCCLVVSAAGEKAGEARISVLHKRRAVE